MKHLNELDFVYSASVVRMKLEISSDNKLCRRFFKGGRESLRVELRRSSEDNGCWIFDLEIIATL
jgi:hypothetical protein